MSPLEQRAHDLVARLGPAPTGAEVGVFRGQFAQALLNLHGGMYLLMVDSWVGHEQPRHGRTQEALIDEAKHRTEFAEDRREIIRMDSLTAAATIEDASLDFVFVDADHSYEGALADIQAWAPKVKPGGMLSGHDYDDRWTTERGYGVVQAVDEEVGRNGWTLELGPDTTWHVRLP